MPVRLPADVYARLTERAQGAATTTTQYMTAALERAVQRVVAAHRVASYQVAQRGTGRVHVSLRLLPTLYEKVATAAERSGASINAYVGFVVSEALRR